MTKLDEHKPQDVIHQQLRKMASDPAQFNREKLAGYPELISVVALGSAEATYSIMTLVRSRNREDRDIVAAFHLMGSLQEGSVQSRLQSIADASFIDTRTARRWADRGFIKIAAAIPLASMMAAPIVTMHAGMTTTTKLRVCVTVTAPAYTDQIPIVKMDTGTGWVTLEPQRQVSSLAGRPVWLLFWESLSFEPMTEYGHALSIGFWCKARIPPAFEFYGQHLEDNFYHRYVMNQYGSDYYLVFA